MFIVTESGNRRLVLNARAVITHETPVYLGGILSQDKTEVLWENTTKPLP